MALKIHETLRNALTGRQKTLDRNTTWSSQNAIIYFAGEEEKQTQDYFERIGEEDS